MKTQVPTEVIMTPGGETSWERFPCDNYQVLMVDPQLAPDMSDRVNTVLHGLDPIEKPDDWVDTYEVLGDGGEGTVYEIEGLAIKIRQRQLDRSSNFATLRAAVIAGQLINDARLYLDNFQMTLKSVMPLGAMLNVGGNIDLMAMAMPIVPGRTLYGLMGFPGQMHDEQIASDAGDLLIPLVEHSPYRRLVSLDPYRGNFILDAASGEAPGGTLTKVDNGAPLNFDNQFDIVSATV